MPAHSRSRSTNFWILPVEVFGRSPNSIAFGTLKPGRRVRQNATISSALAVAPGFKVTNAFGTSPHFGSGIATTAHSSTAACVTTSALAHVFNDVNKERGSKSMCGALMISWVYCPFCTTFQISRAVDPDNEGWI